MQFNAWFNSLLINYQTVELQLGKNYLEDEHDYWNSFKWRIFIDSQSICWVFVCLFNKSFFLRVLLGLIEFITSFFWNSWHNKLLAGLNWVYHGEAINPNKSQRGWTSYTYQYHKIKQNQIYISLMHKLHNENQYNMSNNMV